MTFSDGCVPSELHGLTWKVSLLPRGDTRQLWVSPHPRSNWRIGHLWAMLSGAREINHLPGLWTRVHLGGHETVKENECCY